MASEDILNFMKKAVPWIGAAATGNVPALITMAATAISDKLGIEVPNTADGITAVIAGATPEQMLALKQADNDFAIKMREFGYKESTEMYLADKADVADARKRDIAVTGNGERRNVRADYMVLLDVIGLIACLFTLAIYGKELPGEAATLIATVASIFGLCLRDAHQFEFGSNRQSQVKDTTISDLSKK